MGESIFKKKERIRPPRVHIEYEVELNGAQVMKELPFVVGVLADLAGQPKEAPPALKARKFTEIDRDNFNDILKSMKPRLAYRVDNKLKDDGTQLNVDLSFESLDDFSPENVANQVDPLRQLLEIRSKLKDLQSRMEGNDRLEEMLNALIKNPEMRDKLKDTLGVQPPSEAPAEGGGEGGGSSEEAN